METKETIYTHRAFKRLPSTPYALFILRFFCLAAPFALLVALFSGELTRFFAESIQYFLSPVLPSVTIVERVNPLLNTLYVNDYWGRYPAPFFSLATAVVMAVSAYVALRVKRLPRSFGIYVTFICAITLSSALFFLLMPGKFPYAMIDFSYLYMIIEIGIWFVIPILMAIALIPLPLHIGEQYLIIATTLLYSIFFGLVRYILFFYLLHKGSYILMGTMFIAFDPPLDTFYVLGIYSLYVSWLGKRLHPKREEIECTP